MAHFTARFRIRFAIKMDRHGGVLGKLGDAIHIVADEVEHLHIGVARAIPQRPADNGTNVLFELINHTAVLGPVARIVHARRDFIDHKPLRCDKEFNPHDADIIQRIQYFSGQKYGIGALGGERRAGTVVVCKMPLMWTFSPGSKQEISPA